MQRIEQETVINFNAEENDISISTSDPVQIRKLDKLVESFPEIYKYTGSEYYKGEEVTKRYSFSIFVDPDINILPLLVIEQERSHIFIQVVLTKVVFLSPRVIFKFELRNAKFTSCKQIDQQNDNSKK